MAFFVIVTVYAVSIIVVGLGMGKLLEWSRRRQSIPLDDPDKPMPTCEPTPPDEAYDREVK